MAESLDETEDALRRAILDLLARRAPGSTICPSEAARAVHRGAAAGEGWRDLMEAARQAARALADARQVEITQRGRVVDPRDARGAIRIRAVRP